VEQRSSIADPWQEIERLRRENAQRRVENRDLRGQIEELRQQVLSEEERERIEATERRLARLEAASEAEVPLEQLRAAEALANAQTSEELRTAQQRMAEVLRMQADAIRNPVPPRQPAQPASLDEQIRTAERAGDTREALRLKTQKLVQ
jgi:hypothetical protein